MKDVLTNLIVNFTVYICIIALYILYLHNVICQLYINKARKKDSWINHMMGQSRQLPHKIIKQFSKSTCLFPFGLLLIIVIVFWYLFVITWALTVVFPYLHHMFFISSGFLLSLKRKRKAKLTQFFSEYNSCSKSYWCPNFSSSMWFWWHKFNSCSFHHS